MNTPEQHIDSPETQSVEKEIRQRMESLRSFCEENGRQLLIIGDIEGNEDGRYTCVWSVTTSKHKEVTPDNFNDLMGPFIYSIDSFLKAATGDTCRIIASKKDE
jgi:hypothetical protein